MERRAQKFDGGSAHQQKKTPIKEACWLTEDLLINTKKTLIKEARQLTEGLLINKKNTDKRSMLVETIDQDIKKAMLAKDDVRLRGLRAIKSALLLARTEKGASEVISEETELKVLQKLIKQRKESAEIYQAQNRDDLYQIEKEEMQVIEAYLPQQMGRAEITAYLQEMMKRVGAISVKDMGKVMGTANKELAGKADGKTISEIVKQLLQ